MSASRRAWRVLAIVGTVLATMMPQDLSAITWRASIWGPSMSLASPFESYAKELFAKTGGELKIEITYFQNKPTESADLLKSGARDAAYFCSSHFAEKMPLIAVLDLPMFAPDSIPTLAKVELALADHPEIQSELRKWNAKMLIPVPVPQYQIMSMRPIAKIADLKGAKVSIPPGMGRFFEEYGASTHQIPVPGTRAALNSGVIDVAVLHYPFDFAMFEVHKSARYVTDNISLGSRLCYFAVNQKSFERLPGKIQEIMLSLRQSAMAQYEKRYAHADANANIEAFKDKGLVFVSFSAVDRARLLARATEQWHGWVDEREKQGLKGREVFEFVQTKIREFSRN